MHNVWLKFHLIWTSFDVFLTTFSPMSRFCVSSAQVVIPYPNLMKLGVGDAYSMYKLCMMSDFECDAQKVL